MRGLQHSASAPAHGGRHPAAASDELFLLRKRYDELHSDCAKTRTKLDVLRKRTTSFVNTEELDASRHADAAEIERLEYDVCCVLNAARDTYERRKTYEQIIKRLKEEGTTYWRELGQIDHTSRAKEHDFKLLQLLLKDARHVRDVAKQELSKVDDAVAEERRQRQRALQERRRKLELRQESALGHERRTLRRRPRP